IGPLSQGKLGNTVVFPVVIVPPDVSPALSMGAPVGTLPGPNALLNAINDCQFTVSYVSPAPPRSTVLPLPSTSHAKPSRGPKFLWSGLYKLPICFPTCTRPTLGLKLPSRLWASCTTELYSYRRPR